MLKMNQNTLLTAILSTGLCFTTACGGNNTPDDPAVEQPAAPVDSPAPIEDAPDAPVTTSDIVDFGDLLTQDDDFAAAAAQVGDPAQLLGTAKDAAERARSHIAAILDHMPIRSDVAPDETGTTQDGLPYAAWGRTDNGVQYRFVAVRTGPRRVRYFMGGRTADTQDDFKRLVTGVFVKRRARKGGGRLHLNLTNLSDLGVGPMLDGSLHFLFANGRNDKRGRRVIYRNVIARDAATGTRPMNHAVDLFRQVGVGGRFRTLAVGDLIPELPGNEAYGMRVVWRAGQGGHGGAVMARVTDTGPERIGGAQECWDANGLRLAYRDSFPGNDDVNPNEGTPADCFGISAEDVPDSAVADDASDTDPELDSILTEDGATDVTEADADAEINI